MSLACYIGTIKDYCLVSCLPLHESSSHLSALDLWCHRIGRAHILSMRSPNQSSQSPTTSSILPNKNGRATKRKSQSIDTETPPPHDSEGKGASNGASDQATKKRRKVNHGERVPRPSGVTLRLHMRFGKLASIVDVRWAAARNSLMILDSAHFPCRFARICAIAIQ